MRAKALAHLILAVNGKPVKRFAVSSLDPLAVERVAQSAELTQKEWLDLGQPKREQIKVDYSDVDRARREELERVEKLIPKLDVPGRAKSRLMLYELKTLARELRAALGKAQKAAV